jgi:hypothetical protein
MSARSHRSRSRVDRILACPLLATRARVGTDGTVELLGGPSFRLGPAARSGSGGAALDVALPITQWRETHARFSFRHSVFAGDGCAFERVEIENPFREARQLELRAEVALPLEAGHARMEGAVLRGGRGEALVAFAGAEVLRARLPAEAGGDARVDLRVVLPPRGKRIVEVALGPAGGRAKARSFTRELNATHERWEGVLGGLASVALPEEELRRAFDRALGVLVGSLAPVGGSPGELWPMTGLAPRAGAATLDAVALRALEVWGGGTLVGSCLAAAFATQGKAAPPGEHFGSAEGYLSAPPATAPRERWGSDCGALLWLASSRNDVGAGARTFRKAKPHVLAACEWIMGELGSDGLMPPARAPAGLAAAARAWTDAWSWRGLDAAAAALEELGAASADRVRRSADAYRDRILGEWGADARARGCLEAVHLAEEAGDAGTRGRERAVAASAAALASGRLDPDAELRESAALLLSLRKMFLDDDGESTLRLLPGVPREWLGRGCELGFERLPTRFGPVSVRAISMRSAARVAVDVELPKLPRGTSVELDLGPPVGAYLKEVRVDGRCWRRFKPRVGTIELPPRRVLDVVAELNA